MDAVAQAMGVDQRHAGECGDLQLPDGAGSRHQVCQTERGGLLQFGKRAGQRQDVTDVIGIQSRHAQTQMQNYTLQAQELGRLMMEATQSIRPKS